MRTVHILKPQTLIKTKGPKDNLLNFKHPVWKGAKSPLYTTKNCDIYIHNREFEYPDYIENMIKENEIYRGYLKSSPSLDIETPYPPFYLFPVNYLLNLYYKDKQRIYLIIRSVDQSIIDELFNYPADLVLKFAGHRTGLGRIPHWDYTISLQQYIINNNIR